MNYLKLFEENESQSISKIFDDMIDKQVTLIDSTNFLLKVSGQTRYTDKDHFEIRGGLYKISIMIESIKSYKEFKNENDRSYRFFLKNGNSFTITY